MRNNARKGAKMNNNSKFAKDLKRDKLRSMRFYADCVRCERCDRSILIKKNDRGFCPSCGRYIFKDKKDEFKYRMEHLM